MRIWFAWCSSPIRSTHVVFYINPNTFYRSIKHSKTAGKILRSHVEGNRALIVTNDRLAPLYLDKYEAMMKEGGDIQVGEYYKHLSPNRC